MERLLDPPAGGLDLGIGAHDNFGHGEEVREPLDGSLDVTGIGLGDGRLEYLGRTEDEELFDDRRICRDGGHLLLRG
jgi:hypothetical protein